MVWRCISAWAVWRGERIGTGIVWRFTRVWFNQLFANGPASHTLRSAAALLRSHALCAALAGIALTSSALHAPGINLPPLSFAAHLSSCSTLPARPRHVSPVLTAVCHCSPPTLHTHEPPPTLLHTLAGRSSGPAALKKPSPIHLRSPRT